jgi:hypothetical protein
MRKKETDWWRDSAKPRRSWRVFADRWRSCRQQRQMMRGLAKRKQPRRS